MITSTDSKAGPYTADGSLRRFPFNFRVIDGSHLAVYRNDVEIPASSYGVETTGEGGNVNLYFTPASGDTIAIVRNVPATQETDLQNNTAFLPEVLEDAFDKLTMLVQQLRETLTRTLTVPPTRELDGDTLFQEFQLLVDNAETWAATARTSCEQAVAAMNSASGSAGSALTASQSAQGSAASASADAQTALAARNTIQTLADLADLNYANIAFGDWSEDMGALVAFNSWTAASDISSLPAAFDAHNADRNAHGALAVNLESRGIYPQGSSWPYPTCDLEDGDTLKNMAGTYYVPLHIISGGPETGSGIILLKIDARNDGSYYWVNLTCQNCGSGRIFSRTCANGSWLSGWLELASEASVANRVSGAVTAASETYALRMAYQEDIRISPGAQTEIEIAPASVELGRSIKYDVQLYYRTVSDVTYDTVIRWGTYYSGAHLYGGADNTIEIRRAYRGNALVRFTQPNNVYIWNGSSVIDANSNSNPLKDYMRFRVRIWY